ncbi:J domain-containing protein [Burkholderia pseudomallei]|nr:J domain-containing protein [Burkholderia pseudomallei]
MNNKDPKGYYAILGVAPNADAAEIKATYRRKAMELHPDRNKAVNATEQFQLLNEAYGVLSDPATRAQYDTMSIDSGPQASAEAEEPPEPIVCSCCGKVTAQPRYAIFFEIKSYIFQTTRSAIQGIFCSACAEKKAFKASAITWLFGWWGIPWGPIYSLQAIFTNMFGGKQPANINARLATHQAWVFAVLGKTDIARAIALDALALAKKIKLDTAYAKTKKALGYDVTDEGTELRRQIGKLLELLGNDGSGNRLKDAWSLFRRPFYAQAVVACAVFGWVGYSIATAPPSQPPKGPKPYIAQPQNYAPQQPAYARPAVASNGQPWPTVAGYVNGYPLIHSDGLSKVTVDNSQNDSDVFVKLVSLDGPNAFPVRVFFIPAHGSFTLDSVTAGSYDIRYQDLNTGGRSRSEQFSLEEIPTNDGTQYSNMTMTLYKVHNGNMHTYELSEDEF